jgi:hypothetical protein
MFCSRQSKLHQYIDPLHIVVSLHWETTQKSVEKALFAYSGAIIYIVLMHPQSLKLAH